MTQLAVQPRRIGKYAIDREIGRGGMGVVYLAHDLELEREVALKVISATTGHVTERFGRLMAEARALARLDHPNIPQVFGAGQDGAFCFISRQFVHGKDLLEVMNSQGAFSPRASLRMVRDIAHALATVHQRRILHRDIKTENLMLDRNGRVQIVDFGIAKDLKSKSRMTRDDCYVGTLEYCSPEQLLGEELDPRSDLYSLGVVLYELLTGKLPYEGNTAAQIYDRMMRQQYTGVRVHDRTIPRRIERFVDKLLRLDARRRFPEAMRVVQKAHKLLRTLPLQPPPTP